MKLTNTFRNIKNIFSQQFEQESPRKKKTKKYTQRMIKKYGKTLRRLSKE